MPLPKAKDGESQEDFIQRCMSNDTMKEDFPDTGQRLAVCFSQWKKKDEDTKSSGMSNVIERMFCADMELRVNDDEQGITGYAAVFNSWSEDLGFFKEKIQEGAFKKTIKENDVRALINHDPSLIIGRTKNKTLELKEDDKGLWFDVKLPDTSYANDLRESIRRKDITQNSFGFQAVQDEWSKDGTKRTLTEVKLFDVSPVTFPAYKQTIVKLRDQYSEFGIDLYAFRVALVRGNRDELTDMDIETFDKIARIINRYRPIDEEPLEKHSETNLESADYATLIRARLAKMMIKRHI